MFGSIPIWINDGKHDIDIARFVIEGDDFVEQIVSRAVSELRRSTRNKHLTFASAVTEDSIDTRRAVVEALYLRLSDDYHLLYEFERAFEDATGQQQVRLPMMTGQANRGTCLDLVILFLSCLANVKLWPVYLHLRGRVDHSLGGTWLVQPPLHRHNFLSLGAVKGGLATGELMVVECTGFVEGYPPRPHKMSFRESGDEAAQILERADECGFGFALDVRGAWETGIKPATAHPSPDLAPELVPDIAGRWSKIVDMLFAKLLEHQASNNKKQLAEAAVRLHRAMIGCHEAYLRFRNKTVFYLEHWRRCRNASAADKFDATCRYWEQVSSVADIWAEAIETLAVTLYDMRDVIGIFDPDVLDIINRYVEHESYASGFVQNRLLRSSPYGARIARIVELAGFIGRSLPDSKIADPESATRNQEGDARDFAFAVGKLRTFIRDRLQLSAEDIVGIT
jgi:hypothetical protein